MQKLPLPARAAILVLALLAGAEAFAQEIASPFNSDEARAAAAALDRDQTIVARYQACPADAFRKEASLGALLLGESADIDAAYCAKHPSECVSSCTTKRSGEHCYRLALAFQENEATIEPRYAQMLFQMACALGKASGCTNRAAHLRNAASEGDPLTSLDTNAQEKCEFRSFKIACEEDDPWGCAMLGQAFKNGEGARKSLGSAQRSYKKACRLNPDFAACAFAKSALKDIRRGGHRKVCSRRRGFRSDNAVLAR